MTNCEQQEIPQSNWEFEFLEEETRLAENIVGQIHGCMMGPNAFLSQNVKSKASPYQMVMFMMGMVHFGITTHNHLTLSSVDQ